MKENIPNNWGAFEAIATAVTGFLSSAGVMWWRQTRLEKQQDEQAKEDKNLRSEFHALELKVSEATLTANTRAMNSMNSALTLMAESNSELSQTVANQTKLLDRMENSINVAFNQIRTIEKEYVSKDHFNTFKENCKREHRA